MKPRAITEAEAALIEAAIRWGKWRLNLFGLPSKGCCCNACKLNRAVARVVKERKEK